MASAIDGLRCSTLNFNSPSPTRVGGYDVRRYFLRRRVINCGSDDLNRTINLRIRDHERWCDLQNVAADVEDHSTEFKGSIDRGCGQSRVGRLGYRVDNQFDSDGETVAADVAHVGVMQCC